MEDVAMWPRGWRQAMRQLAGDLAGSKILIIEDDLDSLELLQRALNRAGFKSVLGESNPFRASEVFGSAMPDLVIIDYHLPPTNAFEVMGRMRMLDDPANPTPIVMLTGTENESVRREALQTGVADFLNKHFDHTELLLRVRNVLRSNQLFREVRRQKMWLEETVRIRTTELQQARKDVVERLALAAEFRDYRTGEHTRRVGMISGIIARQMGSPPAFSESLETAALLHDLGKIAVPDAILLKQGPLTTEEYEIVKRHPDTGAQILAGCTEPTLAMAREISLTHHERWDGDGYPRGLRGNQIPLSGRIVAVADSYDAMRTDRPYKDALTHDQAVVELCNCRGSQFDPEVVEGFMRASGPIDSLFDPRNSSYVSDILAV
jgi:putative two-component system response regulator